MMSRKVSKGRFRNDEQESESEKFHPGKVKRKNLLLPNFDGLLRGLLGGAVGLQGLDDRELPRVTSPVLVQSLVKRWWRNNCLVFYLENPFTSDADPCPGLRHFVRLLLKGGKL